VKLQRYYVAGIALTTALALAACGSDNTDTPSGAAASAAKGNCVEGQLTALVPFTAVRASRLVLPMECDKKDGGKERHRATDLVTIVPGRTGRFQESRSATMGSMSVARRAGT